MRFVAWRVIRAVVITGIVAVIAIAVSSVDLNGERHYDITNADVHVELQRDGSLLVTEQLAFHFVGSFQGAFRAFPLNGNAKVTDVHVSEDGRPYQPGGATGLGSYSPPGTFGFVQEVGLPYRIVWHYQASDEDRVFTLTYRVVNAVTVHRDVVDATWNVWGDQWEFALPHLNATFSAQSGAVPQQAWVRPRSLGEDPVLGADATVSIDHLEAKQAVGMRAIFPRNAISSTSGAEVKDDQGLPAIEKDETKQDDAESTLDKLSVWANDNVLLLCIVIFGVVAVVMVILYVLAREHATDTPEYISEPPDDIPAALAYAYAMEGAYDERIVLATLLDLVDRGYYDSRPDAGKDLDLQLKVPGERPASGRKLVKYETSVLDFFDKLLGDDWVALGKMSERIPKHSNSWKNRWDSMNEKLDEAEAGKLGWDRDLRHWRTGLAVVAVLLIVAVGILAARRSGNIGVPLVTLVGTLAMAFLLPGTWLKRLEAAPRQRMAEWHAFEGWTRDFPRLDDDPPATLKLWRRILVYAVAFGTAERVTKSGRIPTPVGEEAAATGAWTSYAVYSGFGGTDFSGFSSSFASQVAPVSSSSGGGGGGGGGGGFSGGGGGGAW